ncbi:hypothetical protein ACKFKG_26230 [Phormidesmis sp. 146-35]
MKDKDADQQVLDAFLFALAQQDEPLSDVVQRQLYEISQFLDQQVTDLDDLAISTPNLAAPYRQAHRLLRSERGVPPAEKDAGENSGGSDNVMPDDIRPKLLEAEKLLDAIQQRRDQAYRILNADDPVQQAKHTFQ